MTRLLLALFFSLNSFPAKASLFFTPQEVTHILEKRAREAANKRHNNEDCLECNGVLYQDENNWSAWINGEKLTPHCPNCRDQKITITAVTQNEVHLHWQHKGEKHIIALRPNQFYDAALKRVIKTQ